MVLTERETVAILRARAVEAELPDWDPATAQLVRLAAVIASADEPVIRLAMQQAAESDLPAEWIEELVLQSYLFVGFPRTLNAMREWRRASGIPAPEEDDGADYARVPVWRDRGELTCAAVYGEFYDALRRNVDDLHPALDAWMVVEGYGKLLGRPGLDLRRRELCVVAVCAVARQERQLHSHLHGARNVGASAAAMRQALAVVEDLVPAALLERYGRLLERVVGD